jgi:hypothetical protein
MTHAELKSAYWPVNPDPSWRPVLYYKPTKLLTNPQPDMPVATILTILSLQSAANLAVLPASAAEPFPGELFAVVPDGTPWPALSALIADATSRFRLGAVYLDANSLEGTTKTDGWTAFVPFG